MSVRAAEAMLRLPRSKGACLWSQGINTPRRARHSAQAWNEAWQGTLGDPSGCLPTLSRPACRLSGSGGLSSWVPRAAASGPEGDQGPLESPSSSSSSGSSSSRRGSENRPDRRASRPGGADAAKGPKARLVREPLPSDPPPTEAEMDRLWEMVQQLPESERAEVFAQMEAMQAALLRERLHAMDDDELRRYVDRVLDKYDNPSFWEATLSQPLALDVVRERLPAEESALLGKLLVSDERTGDVGRGLNTNRPRMLARQLRRLKLSERRLLPGLMARLEEMEEQFKLLGTWQEYMGRKQGLRLLRRATQKGLIEVQREEQQEQEQQEERKKLREEEEKKKQQQEEEQRRSSGSSAGASKPAWGSSFSRPRKQGSAPAPAAPASDQRVREIAELMASSAELYVGEDAPGWDYVEGSRDLQRLKSLLVRLRALAELSVEDLGDSGLTPRGYLEELRAAKQELTFLAATGRSSEDPVVRDCIEFLVSVLASAGPGGAPELQVEPENVGRLAQFVVAAEVWEQYKQFYPELVQQQMGAMSPSVVMGHLAALQELVGGGGRVRWWTLGPEELTDEQRAELAASGCEFALNQERIDALSTVSALDLRFLGELMRSGYSEEMIVKWSLHPEIGPKIRSGEWFAPQQLMDTLTPEAVREAWREAQEGEMEGVDYAYDIQDPPRDPPKAQRQPGMPPQASPRGKKFNGPRRSPKGRAASTSEGPAEQS